MLTLIDEFTRECLAIDVARRMTSEDVLERLSNLLIQRGPPEYIRSDNGPEFTAHRVRDWLENVGVIQGRCVHMFAGYAWNPLTDQRGQEWKQGIGKLVTKRDRLGDNSDIQHWSNSYLPSDDLAGIQHPGSSVLVRDILQARGIKFRLSLWDIGDDPVSSLRAEFEDDATV